MLHKEEERKSAASQKPCSTSESPRFASEKRVMFYPSHALSISILS